MDANTLGRVYASRALLEAPWSELRGQVEMVPLVTYPMLCAAMAYVPKLFPGHQDFLERAGFIEWLQRVTADDFQSEPAQPVPPDIADSSRKKGNRLDRARRRKA